MKRTWPAFANRPGPRAGTRIRRPWPQRYYVFWIECESNIFSLSSVFIVLILLLRVSIFYVIAMWAVLYCLKIGYSMHSIFNRYQFLLNISFSLSCRHGNMTWQPTHLLCRLISVKKSNSVKRTSLRTNWRGRHDDACDGRADIWKKTDDYLFARFDWGNR